ncbi:nicotinate-nucleotide diphosphorylase (carboxylating) [bacterium (candidate division B38) B3_B38]|nr:MAG: nicotinate-nucleotide diphosphorylase (carboxylating) [bacterium (candidate division B38) B3_B38]
MKLNPFIIDKIVREALEEDIGRGDITTDALIDSAIKVKGEFIAKDDFVLAGFEVAKRVFTELDPEVKFKSSYNEGDWIYKGGYYFALAEGRASSLLKAERVALNFLQHTCAIATLTRMFVEAVKGLPVTILDTRKTTPGLRHLEKYAVCVGGGRNHRYNLSDGVLIKDNHLNITSGVAPTISNLKKKVPFLNKIEIEVKNLRQFKEALEAGAEVIMLDNMAVEDIKEAVQMAKGKALLEVSGGITLDNVRQYAATGVDYISVGDLTHSAPGVDISFIIVS